MANSPEVTPAEPSVALYGGPLHGEVIVTDIWPGNEIPYEEWIDAPENEELEQLKTGRYTAVSGQPGIYEWVGWNL